VFVLTRYTFYGTRVSVPLPVHWNMWLIRCSQIKVFYKNYSSSSSSNDNEFRPTVYANDTIRYRHSYYGRRIGTRMRSIKWCYFQWPWTKPNPVFKVTPLFDAKYLTNGYRYAHSYYRTRIGHRTQTFEWHQLQWPWVTSNPDFKVTILFNVK